MFVCVQMGWTYYEYMKQPEWFVEELIEFLNEINKPKK